MLLSLVANPFRPPPPHNACRLDRSGETWVSLAATVRGLHKAHMQPSFPGGGVARDFSTPVEMTRESGGWTVTGSTCEEGERDVCCLSRRPESGRGSRTVRVGEEISPSSR